MKTCPCCGSLVKEKDVDSPAKFPITFRDNGNNLFTANAVPFNDAFHKIIEGKYKGNLVHIWNCRVNT
jgi:hypothetical protein